MTFSVTMPALGESVSEGTVTRWLKSEGDHVAMDEPLLEVSTDKVDTEIPSPVAGILQKIVVGIDQTVPVGAELAIIADGAAQTSTPAPAAPVGPTYRLSQKASRFLAIPARMESPLLGSRDNMAISQTALVASVQKSDSSEGYVRCNPAAALQY